MRDVLKNVLKINENVYIDGIKTKKDLDIAFSFYLSNKPINRSKIRFLLKALNIRRRELFYMAIKGSAAWSVLKNMMKNKDILKIALEVVSQLKLKARLTLWEIKLLNPWDSMVHL